MAERPPLADLPVNTNEMSFSSFSFAEPETCSQKERIRKCPIQCAEKDGGVARELEEPVTCMMCNSVLNSLTLSERSAHVNWCIDQKSGDKKKLVKIKKQIKQISDVDENDIASIFSPSSSSFMASSSSRTMKMKSNIDTKKKGVNQPKDKKTGKNLGSTSVNEKNGLDYVTAVSLSDEDYGSFDIPLDMTLATEPVMGKRLLPSAVLTSQNNDNKSIKDAPSRSSVIPMNLMNSSAQASRPSVSINLSGNNNAHSDLNMSEEEMELFHLRLQLG